MHRRRNRSILAWSKRFARDGEQLRFWVLIAFLLLCAIGGGSARSDVVSLIYLRPAAVLTIALLLLLPGRWNAGGLRPLFLMLAGLAAIIAIQLIPLPPDLWLSLPGRSRYAEAAAAAGLEQPWRQLSLTPDLTINSLAALLVPLAVLIGLAGIGERQRRNLLLVVVGTACVSALLGVVQLTGSSESPAFLYRFTHRGSAVGLFANRNHEALLLAMAFPLLRIWTLAPAADRDQRRLRFWAAMLIGLFLVAMILVTGSRAGLALGAASLLITAFVAPWRRRLGEADDLWWRVGKHSIWAVPLALAALVIVLGRAVALQRLALLSDIAQESRVANLPVMLDMIRDFFPWGSGFGSFDAAFRVYEPDWALAPTYFNHAHNDLVELALTGGAPALGLLVWFVIWWIGKSRQAFRTLGQRSEARLLARGAAVMILLALMASLVDYPLRTPFHAALFMIACAWLARPKEAPGPLREAT